jgi:hypothetical protein
MEGTGRGPAAPCRQRLRQQVGHEPDQGLACALLQPLQIAKHRIIDAGRGAHDA